MWVKLRAKNESFVTGITDYGQVRNSTEQHWTLLISLGRVGTLTRCRGSLDPTKLIKLRGIVTA